MIDIEEIEEEIKRLEDSDCTTYSICEKLSILYSVRDHFGKSNITKNTPPVKQQSPNGMTAM